jgi:hypothetical protein
VILDPQTLAADAQLRYLSDDVPGIQRRRAGRGFRYLDPQGRRITDSAELQRIKTLAIPPAWTDVWISPLKNGHIQATGRDDRGRKQYRYHDRWQEMSNLSKFEGLIEFGRALPRIRRRVAADLRRRHFTRSKVVALVIRLLDITLIRIGNDEYARQNRSFGLSTLRDRHLQVNGNEARLRFRGKSGVFQEVRLSDRRLAKVLNACQERCFCCLCFSSPRKGRCAVEFRPGRAPLDRVGAAACSRGSQRYAPARCLHRTETEGHRWPNQTHKEQVMPSWTDKDERQYEKIKESSESRGTSERRAKEIAARTVNKRRREEGRTPNRTTQGTGNPKESLEQRTKRELYNIAADKRISGRSKMNKSELVQAIRSSR